MSYFLYQHFIFCFSSLFSFFFFILFFFPPPSQALSSYCQAALNITWVLNNALFYFLAPHFCFFKSGWVINWFVFLRSFTGADFSQEIFQQRLPGGCDVQLLPRKHNRWIVTVSILGSGCVSLLEQSSFCRLETGLAPAGSRAECHLPSQHDPSRMGCGVGLSCTCWRAGSGALVPELAIQAPCMGMVCAYTCVGHLDKEKLRRAIHGCKRLLVYLYICIYVSINSYVHMNIHTYEYLNI